MYFLRTWTKSDSVWEGIVVDDKIKIYRFVCGEDDCPSSVSFDDEPYTEDEVLFWIGCDEKDKAKWLSLLRDPQVEMQETSVFWTGFH